MTAQFLLDTNILSETRRKLPNHGVLRFLADADPSLLRLSVLTIGELQKGIALKRASDAEMAQRLAAWLEGLEATFAGQILGIDRAVASRWGEWSAQRPRPVVDTLLAATAHVHQLTLVTRNTVD
ncbi:MAG: type II toxin-antitoxin system VapC family toxin, partial [Acidobacteriaceae bacterium]